MKEGQEGRGKGAGRMGRRGGRGMVREGEMGNGELFPHKKILTK